MPLSLKSATLTVSCLYLVINAQAVRLPACRGGSNNTPRHSNALFQSRRAAVVKGESAYRSTVSASDRRLSSSNRSVLFVSSSSSADNSNSPKNNRHGCSENDTRDPYGDVSSMNIRGGKIGVVRDRRPQKTNRNSQGASRPLRMVATPLDEYDRNHRASSSSVTWRPFQSSEDDASKTMASPSSSTATTTSYRDTAATSRALSKKRIQVKLRSLEKLISFDWAIASVFFCTSCAIALPTTLIPMIGQDAVQAAAAASAVPTTVRSFAAHAASIAIIGGGSGKWFNGIMTQVLQPKTIANWYLLIVAAFMVALSMVPTDPTIVGMTVAGLEFSASAMWATCSVVVAKHYNNGANSDSNQKFARAITLLSLSATSGQVFSKMVLGSFLLPFFHWRQVARYASILPLIGWALARVYFPPIEAASRKLPSFPHKKNEVAPSTSSKGLVDTVKAVLGKRLFWTVGLAHIAGYLARTSDRIMGPFLYEITGLSHSVCAGLTTALTLGFVHGLSRSPALLGLPTVEQQTKKLRNNYFRGVGSLLGLAFCATPLARAIVPHPYMLAAAVVACSATFTSSLAFGFFQIPNLISSSSTFSAQKAMTLCFLDGLGFVLTAPLWATSSKVVSTLGWPAMWTALATVVAMGGMLMVPSVQPMLKEQHSQK